jgi:hypothetical protein
MTAMSAYRQRDGKTVTIGANGEAKRFLASGEPDPEPLAGLGRDGAPATPDQRVWDELGHRFLDDEPLAAEDIAFARPTPENIAAFNRGRDVADGDVRLRRRPRKQRPRRRAGRNAVRRGRL